LCWSGNDRRAQSKKRFGSTAKLKTIETGRVRTDPGKSWNFNCSEFQALESPEKGIGPGISWKVLEL